MKHAYEKARKTDLRSESAWYKVGMILYDGRYYDEALDAFRITRELGGDPMYAFLAMIWQGHVLDLLGKREEAIDSYREVYQKLKETGFEGEWRNDQSGFTIMGSFSCLQ